MSKFKVGDTVRIKEDSMKYAYTPHKEESTLQVTHVSGTTVRLNGDMWIYIYSQVELVGIKQPTLFGGLEGWDE